MNDFGDRLGHGLRIFRLENVSAHINAGCYGMVSIFSDQMNYFSWKHAAPSFIDFKLDSEKFNKATFYRAIMENAAFVTKANIESINDITNTAPKSVIFGGGASKSGLWCQIVSDVLNLPVKVPVVREATALGAAICAGVGAKVYESFDDAISKVVQFDKTFEPNEKNHIIYESYYQKWKKVYKAQLDLADQGYTDHMWIAPGLK